jgi:hypothetical protein
MLLFRKDKQMTDLKTNESTLQAIQRAILNPLSPEDIRKQRVSFIMGSLNTDSHVTRAQVQNILAEQEGLKVRK